MSNDQSAAVVASATDAEAHVEVHVTATGQARIELAWGEKPPVGAIEFTVAAHAALNSALGQYQAYRLKTALTAGRLAAATETSALSIDARMEALEARVTQARERMDSILAGNERPPVREAGERDKVWVEEQGGFLIAFTVAEGFYDSTSAQEVAVTINQCLDQVAEGWRA